LPVRDLIILVTFPPISTPYAGLGDLAIEAFARTLQVHKRALNRQEEKNVQTSQNYALLVESPSADDDRAELPEAEIESEENAQMSAATAASSGSISQREWDLLERMTEIAQNSRYETDSKLTALLEWLRNNLCSDLGKPGAKWRDSPPETLRERC